MRTLSIVIPAYNESRSLPTLLEHIGRVSTEKAGFSKEVIVVNDGSSDDTSTHARRFKDVRCIDQTNQGKGAAVQNGIRASKGEYVLVQDADLEYNPDDYPRMLQEIPNDTLASIYGSRTLGQRQQKGTWGLLPGKHPDQRIGPWFANVLLSMWALLLYGQWITDLLTGYKIYPRAFLRGVQVRTHGFETDHELTAKLIRSGIRIIEVPVDYRPRSVEEGKKIRAVDGLIAMWTLLRFRFFD